MIEKFNKEFTDVLRDIMYLCIKISDSFDRVRILQWIRKLIEQDDTKLESVRIRNEYIHFLRIILSHKPIFFCMPFKEEPPRYDLAPLPEMLSNQMSEKCPNLPPTGPLRPVLLHKSPDGRAFITVKQCPEGGVFCYLSVTPNLPDD